MLGFLQGRDVFVQDCEAARSPSTGCRSASSPRSRGTASSRATCSTRRARARRIAQHVPEFTIVCAPSFKAYEPDRRDAHEHVHRPQLRSQAPVPHRRHRLRGRDQEVGLHVLNYLLPLEGVLSMHCSANVGADGDAALFFGLSGHRQDDAVGGSRARALIGDDEHGWSDDGVFNLENGCYAKVIRLSPRSEPEIYAATRRFGTVLENVVFDPVTRTSTSTTIASPRTRARRIRSTSSTNAVPSRHAPAIRATSLLLTCDAQGVLPPIARLTPDQALYHFVSGYTSKVAGTEAGSGVEPEITSARASARRSWSTIRPSTPTCSSGRSSATRLTAGSSTPAGSGGPFGVGKRISIEHTRALLDAALSGVLDDVGVPRRPDLRLRGARRTARACPTTCSGPRPPGRARTSTGRATGSSPPATSATSASSRPSAPRSWSTPARSWARA